MFIINQIVGLPLQEGYNWSYDLVEKIMGKFIFIVFIISLLLICGYSYLNKRKHFFTRYHLYTLVISILSLYLFAKIPPCSFG